MLRVFAMFICSIRNSSQLFLSEHGRYDLQHGCGLLYHIVVSYHRPGWTWSGVEWSGMEWNGRWSFSELDFSQVGCFSGIRQTPQLRINRVSKNC